jgi:hypothetical protein
MAAPVIVMGGQVVGDPSIYQPWDPSLLSNPDGATQDNKGCPPGWACIYVQDAQTGGLAKVCRVLDQSVLGPQASSTIQNESGPDFWDQSIINIASAAQTVVQGAGNVANALAPFLSGTGLLLVGVVAAFWFFSRGK